MPQSVIPEQTTRIPKTHAKQGVPGQIKEKQNYDKSVIHLPRHSSFMIMHTFADWGNTGQNMTEMNVYTHIGFDDAEEELKRMEEFRKAQAEVEQKKEKPMSQKMFKVI